MTGSRGEGAGGGWWAAEARPPTAEEEGRSCLHCGDPLGGERSVRACPGCGVVLHAGCYEDTEGGRAFATEGCSDCFHRTYWR